MQARLNGPWTKQQNDRDTDKFKGTPAKEILKKINLLVINNVHLRTVITEVEVVNESSALFSVRS